MLTDFFLDLGDEAPWSDVCFVARAFLPCVTFIQLPVEQLWPQCVSCRNYLDTRHFVYHLSYWYCVYFFLVVSRFANGSPKSHVSLPCCAIKVVGNQFKIAVTVLTLLLGSLKAVCYAVVAISAGESFHDSYLPAFS